MSGGEERVWRGEGLWGQGEVGGCERHQGDSSKSLHLLEEKTEMKRVDLEELDSFDDFKPG